MNIRLKSLNVQNVVLFKKIDSYNIFNHFILFYAHMSKIYIKPQHKKDIRGNNWKEYTITFYKKYVKVHQYLLSFEYLIKDVCNIIMDYINYEYLVKIEKWHNDDKSWFRHAISQITNTLTNENIITQNTTISLQFINDTSASYNRADCLNILHIQNGKKYDYHRYLLFLFNFFMKTYYNKNNYINILPNKHIHRNYSEYIVSTNNKEIIIHNDDEHINTIIITNYKELKNVIIILKILINLLKTIPPL